jgi:hypothetical protein
VVHEAEEDRSDRDRGGLRHGERHLEDGVGAALEVAGRAALQQGHGADDDPRQAGAEQDGAGQDDRQRGRGQHRQGGGGDRHAQRAGPAFAGAGHERGRGEPGGHRAHALHGQEHAEEGGGAVQALVDDGEEHGFAEAERDDGQRAGDDKAAQGRGGAHVGEAGAKLGPRGPHGGLALGFRDAHEGQRGGRAEEGQRVQGGHRGSAEDREERGPGERREQTQALAQRLQRGVAVADELAGKHRDEQRGLPGAEDHGRRAQREHHGVDDPHVAGIVDERERGDGGGAREVDGDQQRSLTDAIDEQAGDRRGQLGEEEGEERQAGSAAAAGQLLDPYAHGQGERKVAEEREPLAGEVQPRVPQREEASHAQSSTR